MSDATNGTVVPVTSTGQATIPKKVRDKIDIDTPGRVRFVENEQFDPNQLGRRGTNVLNDPVNDPAQPDLDHGQPHFDVVEQDPGTGNIYHNRVFDPEL